VQRVSNIVHKVVQDLLTRADKHDASKTQEPEAPIFEEFTKKLKDVTYGSNEYKSYLDAMKPALDHHYANNRHHPEHFPDGVSGMTLMDLMEMVADWKAASERHNDGNIMKSIEHNTGRFDIAPQLAQILKNTVVALGLKE
jgi:hypothetical protein